MIKIAMLLFGCIFVSVSHAQQSETKYFYCIDQQYPQGNAKFRIKIEGNYLDYYEVGMPSLKIWTAKSEQQKLNEFKPTGAQDPWRPGLVYVQVNPDMVNGRNENSRLGNYFQLKYSNQGSEFNMNKICKAEDARNWKDLKPQI